MPPTIYFGVNLNFSKYVYGRKRAIEIVRRKFGLHHEEGWTNPEGWPLFQQTEKVYEENTTVSYTS